jgi:hypothetical protein
VATRHSRAIAFRGQETSMVRKRLLADFSFAPRPLAVAMVSAIVMSTAPVHAQSADDVEPGASEGYREHVLDPLAWQTALSVSILRTSVPATTGGASSSAGTATSSAGAPTAASSDAAAATPPAAAAAPAGSSPDDGSALCAAGFVAGGIGIVGFVIFAVAGIGAKNAHDRLDQDCNAGPCSDSSHQSDIESGKMLQTMANIGLATGLTGIGLGATLIVLSHPAGDAPPAVGMSPAGGMITYGARF